ncbi:hypothetical protein [Nostocoides sp. Soil756]|jgi:hypothetical protein|uniref:hypothetical protein n=1 Tax=Nostocoides sp. Soil756 TaxID=1736399 RepID=UPI0006FCEDA3|nr:hypothetical protein [Tetrasphaera sp. Soil756]KRE61198.1 hypothetical protein ASG78_12730 [Tetrasphaera sp. Soil756]
MTTSTALWTTVKDDLRERREQRAAARRLREDLSTYRTPTEIEDLLAMVDAQDAAGNGVAEAPLIRGILNDNLQAYYHHQSPVRRAVGL